MLAVGATGLRARRRDRLATAWHRRGAAVAVLVSAAPAVVLGWLASTTVVALVGTGVALLLAAAVPVVRPRVDAPADAPIGG